MPTLEEIKENERLAIEAGRQAGYTCAVLLILESETLGGRLEAEFKMPAAPFPKLQIGRAGVCRVESVRYSPADGLFICRCILCWLERARPAESPGMLAAIENDTGLKWKLAENT